MRKSFCSYGYATKHREKRRVIRSFQVLCFMLILNFLTSPSIASAQTNTATLSGSNAWIRIGPEGTNLTSVAVDPRNPSTMYATNGEPSLSNTTQVFKSFDGGASWVAFSTLPVVSQGLPAIDALGI